MSDSDRPSGSSSSSSGSDSEEDYITRLARKEANATDSESDIDNSESDSSRSSSGKNEETRLARKANRKSLSKQREDDSSDSDFDVVEEVPLFDPYERSKADIIMSVFESDAEVAINSNVRLRRVTTMRQQKQGAQLLPQMLPVSYVPENDGDAKTNVDDISKGASKGSSSAVVQPIAEEAEAESEQDDEDEDEPLGGAAQHEEKDQEAEAPPSSEALRGGLVTTGVQLIVLQKLCKLANSKRSGMTTAQVVEEFVKPVTKLHRCSLAHFVSSTDHSVPAGMGFSVPGKLSAKSGVGPGNVYISHAWDYPFAELVDAIAAYEEDMRKASHEGILATVTGTKHRYYYWLDALSMNQWKPLCTSKKCPRITWFRDDLPNLIRTIGTFCMIILPWNQPLVLHRTWCLYEMTAAYKVSVELSMRFSRKRHRMFLAMVRDYYEECHRVLATFVVSALDSTARSPLACELMHEAMEEVVLAARAKPDPPVNINVLLKRMIFRWLDREAVSIMSAAELQLRKAAEELHQSQFSAWNMKVKRSLFCNAFRCAEFFDESDEVRKLYLSAIEVMQTRARLLVQLGEVESAELVYERCLNESNERLGSDHSSTLTLMGNLAVVQKKMGKLSVAEKLLRSVMAKKESTLGQAHTSTMSTMINLSLLLRDAGKLEEARSLLGRLIIMQEKVYGENDDQTLSTVECLAAILLELNVFAGALVLLTRILTAKTLKLGKTDREVHAVLETIGDLYIRQEDWANAGIVYSKACIAREKSYGNFNDPSTLNCYSRLGKIQEHLNNWDEAEELYNKLLTGTRETMGETHFGVYQTRDRLLRAQGRNGKVEHRLLIDAYYALFEEANKELTLSDPVTCTIAHHLADECATANRHREAITYYRKAFVNRKKLFGDDNIYSLLAEYGLALGLAQMKQFKEAYELFLDLIARFDDHPQYGPHHEKTMQCIISYIDISHISGDKISTEIYLRRLLTYYQTVKPDHDKAMAIIHELNLVH